MMAGLSQVRDLNRRGPRPAIRRNQPSVAEFHTFGPESARAGILPICDSPPFECSLFTQLFSLFRV
jgi:hypothetical protein